MTEWIQNNINQIECNHIDLNLNQNNNCIIYNQIMAEFEVQAINNNEIHNNNNNNLYEMLFGIKQKNSTKLSLCRNEMKRIQSKCMNKYQVVSVQSKYQEYNIFITLYLIHGAEPFELKKRETNAQQRHHTTQSS